MGYVGDHGHLFKIWFPDKNEIKITRDVDFHEGKDDEPPLFTPSQRPPDDSGPNNQGLVHDFRFTLISDVGKDFQNSKLLENQPQNDEEPITGRVETLSPTPVLPKITQAALPAPESTTPLAIQPTTTFSIENPTDLRSYRFHDETPTDPLPYVLPSSAILSSIEPTRVSSRSTKGIPPQRYKDEQKEQMAKEREKREKNGNRGLALAAPNSLLKVYQIKIPKSYVEMLKSPQNDPCGRGCNCRSISWSRRTHGNSLRDTLI